MRPSKKAAIAPNVIPRMLTSEPINVPKMYPAAKLPGVPGSTRMTVSVSRRIKKIEPTNTLISWTKCIIFMKPRCTKLPDTQDKTISTVATTAKRMPKTALTESLLRILEKRECVFSRINNTLEVVAVVEEDDVEEDELVNGSTVLDVFVILISCIFIFRFVCVCVYISVYVYYS